MKLDRDRVRDLARSRGFTLSEALRRAGVSRNAFYHLARQRTILPRSVQALSRLLGVPAPQLLEPSAPEAGRASALLREARRIHARDRRSSFENIWHTLWLLDVTPAERLQRSLIRGRASTAHR